MKKKFKIAFIGAGRMSEQHLKVFKAIKYTELTFQLKILLIVRLEVQIIMNFSFQLHAKE